MSPKSSVPQPAQPVSWALTPDTFETGPFSIAHWTPFNELGAEEASSPGYRHALARQQGSPSLPYGIDVQHNGAKV